MKKLIIACVMLTICSKIFAQQSQRIAATVKGILKDKLITSKWTDEDDASTASLFQINLKTKASLLIANNLRNDQVEIIDQKTLVYVNDRRLVQFELSSRKSTTIYRANEGVELVGISTDLAKENVYAIELDRKLNLFRIVRINLSSGAFKVAAMSKIDVENVEYVEAKIVTNKTNLYLLIDFTLYDFDLAKDYLKKIDANITSFAIDHENLYYFKNYPESKPQLESINFTNSKKSVIEKVGGRKIVESIFSCKSEELSTLIVNGSYFVYLRYCDELFLLRNSTFAAIYKLVLFENDQVTVYKTNKDYLNKRTSWQVK